MADFDIEVVYPKERPDVAILRLAGSLDTYGVPTLEKKFEEVLEKKCRNLVINCQKLKFLSSPGMGLFLGTLSEVEKQGGSLVFAKVSQPEVHDAMGLLGFFEIFPVCEDEAEAVLKSSAP